MRRSQRLIVGLGCGVPLLVCLSGLVVFQWRMGSISAELKSQLSELNDKGVPTDIQGLGRDIPSERNAASRYQQAIDLVASDSKVEAALTGIGKFTYKDASPAAIAESNAYYHQLGPLLQIVEDATQFPELEFNYDWSNAMALEFEELASMRSFVRLLAFKAEHQSRAGDWRGSLETTERLLKLAQQVGGHPMVLGALAQVSSEMVAQASLRRTLNRHSRNDQALAEARRLLEKPWPLPDIRYALGGEVVFVREMYKTLGRSSVSVFDPSMPADEMERSLLGNSALKKAMELRTLEHWNWAFARLPEDSTRWKEARQVLSDLDARVEADTSLLDTFNDILLPVFVGLGNAVGRVVTERNLSLTTIALYEHRNAHGAFPKTLDGLGEHAIDPFTEKPLIYRPEGQGFLLYSVGTDGKDNGGSAAETGSGRDIVADTRKAP